MTPIVLHNPQKSVAKDLHRFRVVLCGRRWGKTTLAGYELVGKAFFKKDGRVGYIAPTSEQARDIAWREIKEIAKSITVNANNTRMELEIRNKFGGISIIKFSSWQSIIDKESLRGQKFHFIVMDEVSSYKNFWIGWEEIIRPTLTDYQGEVLFIGTPKGYNHFYDLYNLQDTDKDFKSFHYSSYTNPFLNKKEIDTAKKQMTEDRFAQEYEGEFRKMEGLVYKEFRREDHTFDEFVELPVFTDVLVGIDWGFTNPAAVLRIGKDGDNNYWITDEWYKRQQTTDQIIEVAKMFRPNMVYPDIAEPDRIQMCKDAGMNVREVSKDVMAGIDNIRELFKQGRIHISNSCKNLIWELETYHYKEQKNLDKNSPEEPEKKDDHAMDALRYVLYNDTPTVENNNEEFNLYGGDYE